MRQEQGNFYEYRLFGLPIRSQLALPELDTCAHGDPDAITIGPGVVDPVPGSDASHWLKVADGVAVLTVADVARFAIREGQSIVVDPDPAASPRNVRLFLLGSAMGALLHQRGILPLHANAVEIGERAVAFMGRSGAGKSTLAAAFHDRGHCILSDDVCAVTRSSRGYLVQPGIPRLRLWRDAVERTGREPSGYERAFETLDKYTVPTDQVTRGAPMLLGAIFLLAEHAGDAPAQVRRLAGVEAIEALVENTYRGSFISIAGDARVHFHACLGVTNSVPVFRLSRPWDAARIDETINMVEAELQTLAPSAEISWPTG